MCIVDEMKALHFPGLSITVIHDGKIQWTKAFGVKRLDGDAVTAETIFQAGSVSKEARSRAERFEHGIWRSRRDHALEREPRFGE